MKKPATQTNNPNAPTAVRSGDLLGEQLLREIKDSIADYGYKIPMTEQEALGIRRVGKTTLSALIEMGWVNKSEATGLSVRSWNCLANHNLDTKEQAMAAIKSGELKPAKLRNYGWKSHNEVSIWCGLGPQKKQKRVQICPHCGKDTLCPPNAKAEPRGE